jgi:hypothetical protein
MAVYNLLMAGLWASAVGVWSYVPVLVLTHMAAATLPWLLSRSAGADGALGLLRRLYPVVWLPGFWWEVDLVRRRLHHFAHDAWVLDLESRLLGLHPHELWMPAVHDPWISETLHFAYFAYYAVLIAPIAWLSFRRHPRLDDAVFRMMLTFTVCFFLYSLAPVDGPQHTGLVFDGPNRDAFFARLVERVAGGSGESLGAAFPSSHVAGAVTAAWIARLHLPRWTGPVLAAEAAAVFMATFYIQRHYAIDAVAGLLLAGVLQAIVVPGVFAASRNRRQTPNGVRAARPMPPRFPSLAPDPALRPGAVRKVTR